MALRSPATRTLELDLDGRVALVTGASRGLGHACASVLAREGARVAATARDAGAPGLRALARAAGHGEVLPLALDLRDGEAISAVVRRVLDRWGRIDVLVASTPGPPAGPVWEFDDAAWRDALEVHVVAMARLVREVLPCMRERGYGRIIFIATTGVKAAQPGMVLSNATRLALVGLAKTLSLEVAGDGVLVNVIAPGPFATERMDELIDDTAARNGVDREQARRAWLDEVPVGRMGCPDDLGRLVALLASGAGSFVTGAVIPIDGGKARAY
jgi:3-oxoacyl-[acyl-carrier protein] reductase